MRLAVVSFLIMLCGACSHYVDRSTTALDAARRAGEFDLNCANVETALITRQKERIDEVFEVGARGCDKTHTYRIRCQAREGGGYGDGGCHMVEERVRGAVEEKK